MSLSLVLVVEDEFLLRVAAVSLLEEAGFNTLAAGSADEAIGLLETREDIRIVFTISTCRGAWTGETCARHPSPVAAERSTSGHTPVREADLPERVYSRQALWRPELIRTARSLVRAARRFVSRG